MSLTAQRGAGRAGAERFPEMDGTEQVQDP